MTDRRKSVDLAVVGAGPVGLALAMLAAQQVPRARVTVFDAREAARDVSADPRTLALSLGSVQLLQRLGAYPARAATPIRRVHVSQAPPGNPADAVTMEAAGLGVPMLGAVLSYGALVSALQRAWEAEVARAPGTRALRLGTKVNALKDVPGGIEVDAGIAERFDLAVVAEGGVFAEQARRAVVHDYRQTAWVGTVMLQGAASGTAFERFTRDGPVALLPLSEPDGPDGRSRAALVWCTDAREDPVAGLPEEKRLALLRTRLPREAGRVLEMSALKSFPLGLNAERTLVAGRVVRIGNAAQTLHPVAGQGLNLGLRDAYALADRLRTEADVDRALAGVEWSRAPDRWAMIAATDFLARSFTWRWPGLAAARGLALSALQAAPPLKAWLARQMMFGGR